MSRRERGMKVLAEHAPRVEALAEQVATKIRPRVTSVYQVRRQSRPPAWLCSPPGSSLT